MSDPVVVVLDGGAVERLAKDRVVRAALRRLTAEAWSVVIPTVVLAECLSGTARDANANRVISRFGTMDTTASVARTAASLRHATRGPAKRPHPSGIDALVAAQALHLQADVVLTTDVGDLRRLLADRPEIGVERP